MSSHSQSHSQSHSHSQKPHIATLLDPTKTPTFKTSSISQPPKITSTHIHTQPKSDTKPTKATELDTNTSPQPMTDTNTNTNDKPKSKSNFSPQEEEKEFRAEVWGQEIVIPLNAYDVLTGKGREMEENVGIMREEMGRGELE
ncbi:hypothetical protein EG329_008469 [Mollisiaceae sp. DMI_Dod_QoI]|nr:hypothetical protein EG329_008469 [Helotiales sp. DMI_Dod_QoI]